jgi:ABC-type amino acid transport substrate-binding protein
MTCKKLRLGHIGLLLLASVIVLPGSAGAQQPDTVKLYLNYLPHRLTETSGKQYDLLLDVALSGKLAQVPRGAAPLNRARALFLGDTGSCLFPTNIMGLDAGDQTATLIASHPVDIVSLRVYTTTNGASFTSLSDFDPYRVGYIEGSGSIHGLADAEKFYPIPSEEQLIEMLSLGRLDAFLGHHPDTALALEELGKPDALRVSPITLHNIRLPISFVCHDNEQGRAFVAAINIRISDLQKSGQIRSILGPHAELAAEAADRDEKPEDMIR